MYKQNSEYKSIQKKLVAAVAMVLVACIMVVSSSYAWFTLSTAPEVTGIQTSVGSNGNLEMALRKTGTALDAIQSISAGGNTFPTVNTYWGNLVKLDESYGLNEISLAPGRLNVTKTTGATTSVTITVTLVSADNAYKAGDKFDGHTLTSVAEPVTTDGVITQKITYEVTETTYTIGANAGYLWTAVYGPDGRVSSLEQNTAIGIYNATKGVFEIGTVGTHYGVKAIGVVSGLSDAELALRNAKNTVYSTILKVQGDASTSLSQNASELANILVTYYLDKSTQFTAVEWTQINDTLVAMENMAKLLENALDQAVVAVGVYQNSTQPITDVKYEDGAIVTTGYQISWGDASDSNNVLVGPHASLLAAYADLDALNTKIANAKAAMPASGEESYNFDDFSTTLSYLMTTSNIKIVVGGTEYSVEEFKQAALDNVSAIITDGMTVNITGGIYADLAEFVGNYSGSANISVDGSVVGSSFAGRTLTVPTTMTTVVAAPSTGFHLVYANTWLPGLAVAGDGTASSLTDLYAYLIDFAFRTNATGSSLMLQTSAVDRISETNGTDATQGGGSYMEVELGTGTGYTMDQMLELMKAIRIVFYDANYKIVAIAAPDVSSFVELKTSNPTEYNALTKVKAPVYLYNYSFDESGVCTLTTKIAANDSGATELMELVQNQATALSTLVYLDGDMVDNGDVAINGTSITGTMNLQFSSSATLVPMDYTFTDSTPTTSTPDTPTATLDTPTVSLSGKNVTVTAVDNATSYAVYIGTPDETPDATLTAENLTVELTALQDGETVYVVALGADNAFSLPGSATYSAS